MITRIKTLILAALGALLLSSCASLNIDAVPLPGQSYRDGYDIVAEFGNVLNLPERAKVVMNGITVGVVTKVSIVGDHVDVTARVGRDVRVPSDAAAGLEQATVLGDIYVSVTAPAGDGSAPLAPGGRISLARTTSPPQLEDTIASLANFVGSGSIQRAQNSLIQINQITPPKPEARAIVSQVTTDLRGLSDNLDTFDKLLTGASQSSTVLGNRAAALSVWFTPGGIRGFTRDMVLANTFGRLLPSVGSIYNGGYWLVPFLRSVGTALGSIQSTKQTLEAEYRPYRKFIDDYFMPQDKYPAINITSIVGPDGRELSGNVEQVLRMLGAIP